MRPSIKSGDVPLGEIIGICPADGWVANYSPNERQPIIFRVLLKAGELAGIVGSGKSVDSELRPADKVINFTGYQKS